MPADFRSGGGEGREASTRHASRVSRLHDYSVALHEN